MAIFDPVPNGPVELPPQGFVPAAEQRQVLLETLEAAGVELGNYDKRILQWTADWDWSTVATITSWIKRASQSTGGWPE